MEAGKLRHRVVLQTATESSDGMGGKTTSWATTATVWGAVIPIAANEQLSGAMVQAEVDTRIIIRNYAVTEKMRATWSGHTYDIQAVIRDPTHRRQAMLMCRELL